MTTVLSKPKDYRLVVGMRYLNASESLIQGMRVLHKNNPFHFLVSLRSFIEYTRRGIWFLMWASDEQLGAAEHLTFKQSDSPPLAKMDSMLKKAMGAGNVSHLDEIVEVFNEPFIDLLHSLTHGNPISVRFLAMRIDRVFNIPDTLARAEHELNIYKLLLYRRLTKMPQKDIWNLLKPIHDNPQLLRQAVLQAAADIKKQGGVKIAWRYPEEE